MTTRTTPPGDHRTPTMAGNQPTGTGDSTETSAGNGTGKRGGNHGRVTR